MKIIQTFWSGNQSLGLGNKAGWLSAEYHWISWALSCLTLRQFYDQVTLYTDESGKEILIDLFNLPYTYTETKHEIALKPYPKELWALAKIYSYSLQNEPFLHIDGDVYIWKKFDKIIEDAPLVAQNYEIDFAYYYKTLAEIQEHFEYIPVCMIEEISENPVVRSANTGIIGGDNLAVFQEYAHLAFKLINQNQAHLSKIDLPIFNIAYEQFLYYSLAQSHQQKISYLFDNQEGFDASYKGFARFECVPYQTKFIHALGEFKRQPETCQHLAKRLRKDYPEHYYHILKVCQEANIEISNQAYQLSELSPMLHDARYFLNLKANYTQLSSQASNANNWLYFYGKDMANYEIVESLYSLSFDEILNQQLIFDNDATIIEVDEPSLKQSLKIANVQLLSYEEFELDTLNMVLYDAFLEKKSIRQAIDEVAVYFPKVELENDFLQFQNLILDRIKEGLYRGALRVCIFACSKSPI